MHATIHNVLDDDDVDAPVAIPSSKIPQDEQCHAKLRQNHRLSICDLTTRPVCYRMLLGDNDKISQRIDHCLESEII
jgi:hypothetical protein